MRINKILHVSNVYNSLLLRERVLLSVLVLSLIFFVWYVFFGYPMENKIDSERSKQENLSSSFQSSLYDESFSGEKERFDKDVLVISKRMSSIISKITLIDNDIKQFNEKTIAIDEVVLLLRDLLEANSQLTLQSLKVYPSELISNDKEGRDSVKNVFKKSKMELTLSGKYMYIFDYFKKIESLEWSVFWDEVEYSVDQYPIASVTIRLYTLSIVEDDRYVMQ